MYSTFFALVTKNLNPFLLERKISDFNKQEMIYMLWKECVPVEFYKYTCLEENFVYLKGKNVLYPKVSKIVLNFIQRDKKTTANSEITCVNLKTFFSTFTFACVLMYIVRPREEFKPKKHVLACV